MLRYFFVPILLICVTHYCSSLPSPKSSFTRIVNGVKVESNGYVVGLQVAKDPKKPGEKSMCGGTLIDNSRVLTAAHCFFEDGAKTHDPTIVSRIEILINSIYYDDMDKDPEKRSRGAIVEKPVGLRIHPDYNNINSDNDIAILFLKNPVSDDVKKAQLPSADQTFPSDNAVTMGWGDDKTNGTTSNTLMKALMVTMTNEDCKKKAPGNNGESIHPFHICSYGREEVKNGLEDDSCQGDSGGPLLVGDVLVGVVSFNFPDTVCGQNGVPAVYARVTHYLNWINTNVNPPPTSTPEEQTTGNEEKPESQTEEETTGNEVKRVFTEKNPLVWRGNYQNYHVGLPFSYYGYNAVPPMSPLWRGYQTFNPVYGQNVWSLLG